MRLLAYSSGVDPSDGAPQASSPEPPRWADRVITGHLGRLEANRTTRRETRVDTAQQLVVKPWKRYGHDRLYVSDSLGARLGYLDNKTGDVVVEDEAFRTAVEQALGLAPAPPARELEPYAVTIDALAQDLATNRPGTKAAVRAREELRAAPVASLLARVRGQHTPERAWRVGALGERIVAAELDKLKPLGWVVIHDIEVGSNGANFDHLVVGPGGVFVVESKYRQGKSVVATGATVIVDGYRTHLVAEVGGKAKRVAQLLTAALGEEVAVTGILAIVSDEQHIKRQPRKGDVLVLRPHEARHHLASLPQLHAQERVDRLGYLARRSTTWTG